ncbi:hypothetical protein TPB0596_20760 [Tsukamurella pulmonis]|nr:hypothetical protein TPB0596_04340 [Tsukamurella pulmonis]BDD82313.1 hypothetical protein TPB0596_20760 [Tsukamurella pulmonis]
MTDDRRGTHRPARLRGLRGAVPVAGHGGAFLRAEWLHLYLPALALPVLAQGLATGLRSTTVGPMSKEQL